MKNLVYRLYAEVEMNREVDSQNDLINAGGFTMTMAGKEVTFDFFLTSVQVGSYNRKRVCIECKDPDYGYEQTADITKEMLERVQSISDFFIFTGEKGETDLKPKKLLGCYFYLPEEDARIGIPDAIIKKARLGSNV